MKVDLKPQLASRTRRGTQLTTPARLHCRSSTHPTAAVRANLQRVSGATTDPSASGQATDAAEDLPGPEGAFQPGQEAATRQQLFNRIAPVYDEVGVDSACNDCISTV